MKMEYHYIAFIDVLGFKEMVTEDTNSSSERSEYLTTLLTIHESLSDILSKEIQKIEIIQFSDSIILSMPFDPISSTEDFLFFVKNSINVQRAYLEEGILCRGGIVIGKHFFKRDFIFSDGLIQAYYLECKTARNPRIVLSMDALNIIFKDSSPPSNFPFLRENDGNYFLDYLSELKKNDAVSIFKKIYKEKTQDASVREKMNWLIEYFNFKFPDITIFSHRRFT
jgi:hypothetical protein